MAGLPTLRPTASGRPLSPARIARALAEREATALDLEEAAKALGYESAEQAGIDLGEGGTRQALILWMLQKMALRGSQWAIQNLIDRWVPKPRRVELTGAGGGAVAVTAVPPSAAGSQEAADYFAQLDAAPTQSDDGSGGYADESESETPTSAGYAAGDIIDVEALTLDPSGEDLL